MSKVHRVSVMMIDNQIQGLCTCGRGTTVFAKNTPRDHLVQYRAFKATRQLMERHWWRAHAKNKLFGPNWKSISPLVPPKPIKNTFEDYLSKKEKIS